MMPAHPQAFPLHERHPAATPRRPCAPKALLPWNRLLACLPEAVWQRWQPHLVAVELALGEVLCEPGGRLTHVVFPTTAIIAQNYLTEEGHSAGTSIIGNEGMVGNWLVLGGASTPAQVVVLCVGSAWRMRAGTLTDEFEHSPAVMHLLLRFTQALMMQTGQTAVCNRHHTLEQQLCGWLLRNLDRLTSNEVVMAHELIASMLGVRREGVTEAAGHLHKAGLIDYHRGHIEVLDRHGLERRACECYGVVRHEYERLLPEAVAC